MSQLALIIASVMVALMAMPASLNFLALAGGDLQVSVLPLFLTAGLVLGLMVAGQKFAATRRLLSSTNRYFLFFIFLATVSVVWSAFPLTTLYRLYRLYALVLTCLLFSLAGWQPARIAKVLLYAVLFITVGSIVYYGVDRNGALEKADFNGMILPELVGAWRGITLHKNTLGAVSALGVIVASCKLVTRRRYTMLEWAVLFASTFCLFMSRSSTSIFATAFALALIALIIKSPAIKKRRVVHFLTIVLVSLFLIYSLGVLNIVPGLSAVIEPLVAMTGKDMTFSGRTTIWAIMKDQIVQHPWLGIGYASFWLGPDLPSPAFMFKIRMWIYPGEAHNGYLDVMNELGTVGVLALIAYLYEFLRQAVRLLAFDRRKGAFFIGLLFSQLIANMSEAHWWNLASVNFLIMTLATFDLAVSLRDARRRQPMAPVRPVPMASMAPPARGRAPVEWPATEPVGLTRNESGAMR